MWLNRWHNLVPRYMLGTAMVAALVGCVSPAPPTATLEPSLMDQSILTDVPCAAPCWYGLELGKSTKADALATAHSLSFIDPKEFPEKPAYYMYWDGSKYVQTPGTFVHLRCRQPDQTCASLLFVNDLLKEVLMSPNYDLTFGEVVAHLGAPDYIGFAPIQVESGALCSVSLIWKQRGITASFSSGGAKNNQVRCNTVHKDPRVDRNLPVQQIMYILPENIALAAIPSSAGGEPWAGFLEP